MLQLIDVKKDYQTASQTVHALKGVNLRFRKNEFVSILGASGCGKTTMLNIIGGLDHYTSGDLIINGKSTKTYKDRDWDVYRNHRIGFVFQSYNLIPHQTVLGNVEIALTIAGVSKSERRERAEEALKKVGLEAEMHKRPNQLSGGQMQRVAIARALVNNPEILLADEPTGALDTETSVQIMDLIREIAGERLVIMVTHNPELAQEYSSRIVRLQDGLVLSDSNPYEGEEIAEEILGYETKEENFEEQPRKKSRKERSSMSFKTSLGLSAKNLLMKKGRTIITSIAGSIGIISVCLVLALSNGFNKYILQTQEDMLSSNPLKITESTVDVSAIMAGMNSASDMPDLKKIGDNVYVNSFLTNMAQGMTVKNNLTQEYKEYVESMDKDLYETIAYGTGMTLDYSLYTKANVKNATGNVMSLSVLKQYYTDRLKQLDTKYSDLAPLVSYLGDVYGKMPGTLNVDDNKFGDYVLSQYDVLAGEFPTEKNHAVVVIGSNNDMTDLTLAQLGVLSEEEFMSLFPTTEEEKNKVKEPLLLSFADRIFKQEYMLYNNNAVYAPAASDFDYLYDYKGTMDGFGTDGTDGTKVQVTAILRLKEGRNYGCLGGDGLFLTEQLYGEHLNDCYESKIAKSVSEQIGLTTELLPLLTEMMAIDKDKESFKFGAALAKVNNFIVANKEDLKPLSSNWKDSYTEIEGMGVYMLYGNTLLRSVGGIKEYSSIAIYTDSFESKEKVLAHLDKWNDEHGVEEEIKYTDTVGVMMSMVEMMLNAITVVLVAFTAISLVVSSVMIGIITYVSVVERVKEIGVLRSLGARKKDIKNLFNAETFIIGLSSGVFGVVVTYLLSLGINALLGTLTGIATLAALPFTSAVIMIAISVVLTLISGLIPAGAAAKKDPVVALRTE